MLFPPAIKEQMTAKKNHLFIIFPFADLFDWLALLINWKTHLHINSTSFLRKL